MKIFQNLLRIKSSISKQAMQKHVKENAQWQRMLGQFENKPDPLISIEQRHKNQRSQQRRPSPFVGRSAQPALTKNATNESMDNS